MGTLPFVAALLCIVLTATAPQQAARAASQRNPSRATTAPGLRVEIQNVVQAIGLQGNPPRTRTNEPVFCESLKLTLVLAHDGQSKTPILISAVRVNAVPADAGKLVAAAACHIDAYSSQPHGIVETNTFFVTLDGGRIKTRFLKDQSTAVTVEPTNLLNSPSTTRAITLKPNEEPVGLDIIIHTLATRLQAVTFSIAFDHNGARTLDTPPILIWR